MQDLINLRLFLNCLLLLFLSSVAIAQQKHKKPKKENLESARAIQKAHEKSYRDHITIRQRVAEDNDERLDSYREHDFEFKEAEKGRRARKSTLKAIKLDKPDYYYEEVGEDQSGLNGLRSREFEDYEDFNIDQELREISSTAN